MKTSYACTLALALLLFMQNEKLGEVKGEILDMRGKPIAGALVVYTNVANRRIYSVKTDSTGRFLMIGLMLGVYDLEITGPAGQRIYSGQKTVYAVDKQALNVIQIDLSIIPTKASLAPFLGVKAEDLQKEGWRNVSESTLRDLTPEQAAELKKENALIAGYNDLTPQVQAAVKTQDWNQAAALLRKLIEIAPYKWQLYQNLGTMLRNLGHFEESAQAFEKGIELLRADREEKKDRSKLNATVAQMQIDEGEALVGLEKMEAAAAKFRSAAELDPKPAMAYLHLCTTEYNAGHPDAALDACAKAIAAEPKLPESYQVMAGVLNNLERYQDAVHAYERGIAVAQATLVATRPSPKSNINSRQFADPSRAIAAAVRAGQMMQSAGNIYFQLKNYPRAADLFRQAAKLHPYPALPLFNLCATLYDMNNFSGAAAACDRAIDADPKSPDPYFVKASAVYGESAKHGRFRASAEATSALQKYLELAPEGFYAKEARALLQQTARK